MRDALRMRRTDRYVSTSFALAFAATLALVAALFVVVDAFQDLDRLVELFRRDGVFVGLGVLARYYAARFLSQLASLGEIVAIAPALVVAASMARANEFVAVMAGGTSLRRAALPLFVGCALLGPLNFGLRNLAGPAFVRSEHADLRRIRGHTETLGQSLSVQGHDPVPGTRRRRAVVVSLEEYDPSSLSGRGFAAQVIEPAGPLVDIRAPVAAWDERRHEWRFPGGATKWLYYGRPGSTDFGELSRAAHARPLVRIDRFQTALGPDLLEVEELGAGVLTLGGLWRQRARPRFASELHERIAQLFVPLVLALAALPFVLTADPSRVLRGAVLAILVVVSYEMLAHFSLGLAGAGYLPAFVGGWLVPFVFAGFGVWRVVRLRT